MTQTESYAPHLRGVSGVLHIANDASCPTPQENIDRAVAVIVGLMREAAKVSSIRAFTLTSSRAAAFDPPAPGERLRVSSDTSLHDAVDRALAASADAMLAYQASKVEGENTCVALRDVAALHIISLAAGEANGVRLFANRDTWCVADVFSAIGKVDAAWQPPKGYAEAAPLPCGDIVVPNERFRELK
ncbi:hypothetical protein PG984_013423 [Apiospora sp. TS-2023a]